MKKILFSMDNRKNILKLATVVIIFLIYSTSNAANMINAASCSFSDVQNAVNSASSGDTVFVPVGTCSWTSQLLINKAITLMGAGASLTQINANYPAGALISIQPSSDIPIRVTGLHIVQPSSPGPISIGIYGNNNGSFKLSQVRVDHNTIEQGTDVVWVAGWVEGLIDNNTFLNCDTGVLAKGDDSYSWSRPIAAGTANALFIENNLFIVNSNYGAGHIDEQVYHQQGARTVTRYNTFDTTAYTGSGLIFDTHGNFGSNSASPITDCRGQPLLEVYNNSIATYTSYRYFNIRGGSVLVHDNIITQQTDTPVIFSLAEEEAWTTGGPWCPTCPKVSSWPATDQIFNSFFWNNTLNGAAITTVATNNADDLPYIQPSGAHIDYWMAAPAASGGKVTLGPSPGVANNACTSNGFAGTVAASCCHGADPDALNSCNMTFSASGANAYYPYTPYTCPHPLAGLTGKTCSSSVAGTAGYNIPTATYPSFKVGTGSKVKPGAGSSFKLQ